MKSIALLVILLGSATGAIHAATPDHHGDDKVTVPPDACCAVRPAGTYSKNSIYQTDAAFTTDSEKPFELGSLAGRPVVLAMFFTSCGYACPLIVTDMQAIREKLPIGLRDQARFVLITFDADRDQPSALAEYRKKRGLNEQWTLLHAEKDSVREVAALLGVKYAKDADGAFSHSNVITVLNSKGEIVHQRLGLQGGLEESAAAVGQEN